MRRSGTLAVPALLVIAGLVGCAPPDRTIPEPTIRDVQLVEPAAPAEVKVSELEAGRPLRAAPRPRVGAPESAPEQGPDPDVVLASEPVPTVSSTLAPAPDLVPAPMSGPSAQDDVVEIRAAAIQPTYAIDLNPPLNPSGGRGPVIIRGGRGGIHDDCDLHRPGVRRIPIAINRSASPSGSAWMPRTSPGGIR